MSPEGKLNFFQQVHRWWNINLSGWNEQHAKREFQLHGPVSPQQYNTQPSDVDGQALRDYRDLSQEEKASLALTTFSTTTQTAEEIEKLIKGQKKLPKKEVVSHRLLSAEIRRKAQSIPRR